ncbi:MAG: hypothetical protein IJN02_00795 [Bacteroidales bacterium]|nr:hypothetical protein [Bacteroidales bacterium]
MQYLIRAIKYFFYFSFLCTATILALVLIGAVEGDINSIFRGGYESLWKIVAFFALVSAVYPKLGFISRKVYINGDMTSVKEPVVEFFRERRYEPEHISEDVLTFRVKGLAGKLSKMYEDRITFRKEEDGFFMEGLRKDVLRLSAGLEHRLTPQNEE